MNSFKASYETNSYVKINETIKLNFICDNKNIKWESSNENIAVVNDGVVTGKSIGNTNIKVIYNDGCIYSFSVTVIDVKNEEIIEFLLKMHNSNVCVKKDLFIDGNKPYNYDIVESVNNVLFSPLEINKDYLLMGNKKWSKNCGEVMSSIEFITVHYTANNNETANALAHAKYFTNDEQPTSIHFNTGNDGVYMCLDNDKRAAHAGDSSGPTFEWVDTGIDYDGCNLKDIDVNATSDFYFTINGKKTIIKLPETYKYNDRKTKHIYCSNGLINIEDSDVFKTPKEFFNKMGFAFNIKNNRYYMSKTWWCYQQTLDGAICNVGGNRNSIGIESCVNYGSDLWLTWQLTAKLVAKLLIDNKLDITRVKGHHFYTAKNCPQPMLENGLEMWHKFIELVEAEYCLINKFDDYEIRAISLNKNYLNDNGRVIKIEENACVSYNIEVINKRLNKKTILTLSSIITF